MENYGEEFSAMQQIIFFWMVHASVLLSAVTNNYHEADSAFYQSVKNGSTVTGTVTLPAVTSVERTYRGRAYRSQRGTSSSASEEVARNPLTDTVISLHPVSFEIQVKPLDEPSMIIQENAVFIPHVTPVIVGSIVEFVNNDTFYHNVFSLTPGAKFNIGRRPTGDVYPKEIPETQWKVEGLGEIQLFCDIHSQMNAVILSLNTPYYTRVNEDGTFEISGLPEGTYELKGYNPSFEVASRQVQVDGENSIHIDLKFSK